METTLNVRFREEQAAINVIIAIANPDLVEEVRLRKDEQGVMKTTNDFVYLQEYEIRILEQIVIYCTEKRYQYIADRVELFP